MGETCNHQCDSCGSNGNCSTQDLEHEKRVKEHTSGVKNVIAVVGGNDFCFKDAIRQNTVATYGKEDLAVPTIRSIFFQI